MLVVLALCMVLSQAGAQKTMSVLNTWLQHDVTQNGVQGIKVHCQVYLADYKDQEVKVVAYFYKAKYNPQNEAFYSYRTNCSIY